MKDKSKKLVLILVGVYLSILIFQLSTLTIITGYISTVTGDATQGTVSLTILIATVEAPILVEARLNTDGSSVDLNWTPVSGATYIVYYSENITEIKQLDPDNLALGITSLTVNETNWTDSTAGSTEKRYYAVASTTSGIKNVSTDLVGKFNISIVPATLTPGEIEINTISLPLNPIDARISTIIPSAGFLDTISWYNPSNVPPSYDSAFYLGSWVGDFDSFEPGKGYVFGPIATAYNFTIVGDVPENNITIEIIASTLTPGQVEIDTVGWNSPETQCGIGNLIPSAGFLDTISWYDPSNAPPSYDSAFYLGSWVGDFDCFEPGKGYVFGPIATGYNWTYNRS